MRFLPICWMFFMCLPLSSNSQTIDPTTGWLHLGSSHYYGAPSSGDEQVSIDRSNFFEHFRSELELTPKDNMVLEETRTDDLGITHHLFSQMYQGVPVYGGGMILHERNGIIEKANGQINTGLILDVQPQFSAEDAMSRALQTLGGSNPIAMEATLLVLPGKMQEGRRVGQLCYSIHIHSDFLLEDREVFIDAHSGQIVQTISNICLGDEEGTANTLFSGTQTITTDENGGSYTLKETGRPIETLNLHHAVDLGTVTNFTDNDNQWTEQIKVLRSININTIGAGWWEGIPGDVPDIFLVVKDGSNATVTTTPVMMDVVPPFSVPLQLTLTNPPYTVSIFEDDNGPQQWGGQFNISTSLGVKTFSIIGNTGTYESVQENDPALDAHWGVEQTYDYFMDVHNRNSYDGQGGQIISYVHFAVGWPNAFWSNNSLKLGDGDGVKTTHRTYLNVISHEITHGVINENGGGGLKYQGESGALSESFADIFGTAVEHYAKPATADWLHGEEGSLIPGEYVRSMADPRAKEQPDTYGPNDSFWANPLDTMYDFGGVHINSGVQNYWFYLLSEGGSGVNENGYAYIVDSIGLEKAEQIAYRNLTQYISASTTSTFMDSRMGSIMAAEDLYGAGSPEVMAVQMAWAAVGVGTFDPGPTCMGLVTWTDPSGLVQDGSGMFDYGHNADCSWLIDPVGVNSITLMFAQFDLDPNGDTLYVYDGGDVNSPLLAALTGNVLPGDITSSDGIMFLHFISDGSGTGPGWEGMYSSSAMTYCSGLTTLTTLTGNLTDGSGMDKYGNGSDCSWLIQPVDATGITLTFSALDTEQDEDVVTVYDGTDSNAPVLGAYSGSNLPSEVTSTGGAMFIHFVSNGLVRRAGWEAGYTSSGPVPSCAGMQTITAATGTVADGSGSGPYGDNSDCSWLIAVDNANSITWTFTGFDLENGPDSVLIYDGGDANAPLLLGATGSNVPPEVQSSDGQMFVRFVTNDSGTSSGWSASYLASFMTYCNGTELLTSSEGDLSDGSGGEKYGNGSDCSWLIQPVNAKDITLTFTSFDTEEGYDFVTVYDGEDEMAPELGTFSGGIIPSNVMSTGGSMYIRFTSDYIVRTGGWSASYVSSEITSTQDPGGNALWRVYPNPTSGELTVELPEWTGLSSSLTFWNVYGQLIKKEVIVGGKTNCLIDLQDLHPGVYQIIWTSGEQRLAEKVLVK